MPTYEYVCESVDQHHFERFQSFTETPVQECPVCGASVHRVIFSPPIIFKGPGFFRTENKKVEPASSEVENKTASDGKDAKAEQKSGDKTESTTAVASGEKP